MFLALKEIKHEKKRYGLIVFDVTPKIGTN